MHFLFLFCFVAIHTVNNSKKADSQYDATRYSSCQIKVAKKKKPVEVKPGLVKQNFIVAKLIVLVKLDWFYSKIMPIS